MKRELVVSGGDGLRTYALTGRGEIRRIRLEGAGAFCLSGDSIFCASDWGNVIWRLDRARLVPTALFAGGAGMRRLRTSPCGMRLYALCTEADSVLLLDAASGAPLMLNRVGLNPQNITLDETGGVLTIAAGESGEVMLLHAQTLSVLARLPMPGIVYDALLWEKTVYALCLNETLSSTLVTVPTSGIRQILRLAGMPAVLMPRRNTLICATEGYFHTINREGTRILKTERAAGRADRLIFADGEWIVCDSLTESVITRDCGGRWQKLCSNARDIGAYLTPDEPS